MSHRERFVAAMRDCRVPHVEEGLEIPFGPSWKECGNLLVYRYRQAIGYPLYSEAMTCVDATTGVATMTASVYEFLGPGDYNFAKWACRCHEMFPTPASV